MSVSSDASAPECCFCPLENKKKESLEYDLALCPHCKEVFYCSEEHYRLHRSHDGSQCLPFRVIQTKDRGRIVVATRQVKNMNTVVGDEGTSGILQDGPRVPWGSTYIHVHMFIQLHLVSMIFHLMVYSWLTFGLLALVPTFRYKVGRLVHGLGNRY